MSIGLIWRAYLTILFRYWNYCRMVQESASTPHNIRIRNLDRKNKDFSLYRLSFIPLPLFPFAQHRLSGPLLMKFCDHYLILFWSESFSFVLSVCTVAVHAVSQRSTNGSIFSVFHSLFYRYWVFLNVYSIKEKASRWHIKWEIWGCRSCVAEDSAWWGFMSTGR